MLKEYEQPKLHLLVQWKYFLFHSNGKKVKKINIQHNGEKHNRFNMPQPKPNQPVYPVAPNASRKVKSTLISIRNEES